MVFPLNFTENLEVFKGCPSLAAYLKTNEYFPYLSCNLLIN